mmetsp:Transcript_14443/g.42068  ORF Transcript_14443/g.42068 Transcript_14443/m.42068 type:complete len:239 (-) Transcript_14443:1771-2487(-)
MYLFTGMHAFQHESDHCSSHASPGVAGFNHCRHCDGAVVLLQSNCLSLGDAILAARVAGAVNGLRRLVSKASKANLLHQVELQAATSDEGETWELLNQLGQAAALEAKQAPQRVLDGAPHHHTNKRSAASHQEVVPLIVVVAPPRIPCTALNSLATAGVLRCTNGSVENRPEHRKRTRKQAAILANEVGGKIPEARQHRQEPANTQHIGNEEKLKNAVLLRGNDHDRYVARQHNNTRK